jgi:hypothetical protein
LRDQAQKVLRNVAGRGFDVLLQVFKATGRLFLEDRRQVFVLGGVRIEHGEVFFHRQGEGVDEGLVPVLFEDIPADARKL